MHNQFLFDTCIVSGVGERTDEVHRSMPRAKFLRKNQLKVKRSVPADTAKAVEDKLNPADGVQILGGRLVRVTGVPGHVSGLRQSRLSHPFQGKEQAYDVMKISRAPDGVSSLHFRGNLSLTESGIHQVQASPGFRLGKPQTSTVDSAAINVVASSSALAKGLVESQLVHERWDLSYRGRNTHPEPRPEGLRRLSLMMAATQFRQTFHCGHLKTVDFNWGVDGCRELAGIRREGRLHREPGYGKAAPFPERTKCAYSRSGRRSQ